MDMQAKNVIDLALHRAQLSAFKPLMLYPHLTPLPYCVAQDLGREFIGVYESATGWIGIDRSGFVYTVDVTQDAPDSYSYEATLAEVAAYEGGPAAA